MLREMSRHRFGVTRLSDTDWHKLGTRYVAEQGNDLILFRTRYDSMRNPRNQKVMQRLVLESVDWVNMVRHQAVWLTRARTH